jgi:hypothetical protein
MWGWTANLRPSEALWLLSAGHKAMKSRSRKQAQLLTAQPTTPRS